MKKRGRIESVDLIRAIGILSMVQIHIAKYLLNVPGKSLPFYTIMNSFGQIAAPFFLVAVGISLVISTRKRKQKGENSFVYTFKRGLFLIVIGLLFMFLWPGDILHYIGVFLIVTLLLLYLPKIWRVVVSFIFLIGAPIALMYVDYMAGWERLAYTLSGFWTFTGFFNNLLFTGFHPIFPWIFFVIMGSVIGEYMFESIEKKKEERFVSYGFIIGVIFMLIGWSVVSYMNIPLTFYPTSISYVLFYFGFCLLFFSLFFSLLDVKKKFVKPLRPLLFLGTISFSMYIFHVILGLGIFYLMDTLYSFNMRFVVFYIILLLIAISAICYLFVRKIGYAPFEWLMRKFSRGF